MADRIQWATLADPGAAVAALSWPSPTFMYLERVPGVWLNEDDIADGVRLELFAPTTAFDRYERGRIFCAAFELRWEQFDGAYSVVLVGDAPDAAGFAPAPELDLSGAQPQTESYFLWGLRIEDRDLEAVGVARDGGGEPYLELRIPRVLRYPVTGTQRQTVLTVCEYVDRTTGDVLYHRFTGVEERP